MSAQKKPGMPPVTVLSGAPSMALRDALAAAKLPKGVRAPDHGKRFSLNSIDAGPPGMTSSPPPIHLPGNSVFRLLQHPSLRTLDRLFRVLPEEGFFDPDLAPSRPFSFPIGAYEVPRGTALWLLDYEFRVLRQSGVDPGDTLYAEDGRFTNIIGFDLYVSGLSRPGDLGYELDPQPLALVRPQFVPATGSAGPGIPTTPADVFDASAAASFGNTAGPGSSLMPVTDKRQGPRQGPFTIVVTESNTVNLGGVLFHPFTTPIAAVQGSLGGFLLHTNTSEALLNRLRPQ